MPLVFFEKIPLDKSHFGYLVDGYIFNPRNDRLDENNNPRLRCQRYRNGCKVTAQFQRDQVFVTGDHNHERPNAVKLKFQVIRNPFLS